MFEDFQLLVDGSQIEFVKKVYRNGNTLCVLRYKPGVFPEAQILMKAYKNKGIKFTKTGGNSWLSIYYLSPKYSGIFIGYKDNYINLAKGYETYESGEYESDRDMPLPLYTFGQWDLPTKFTSSEIEEAWAEGVAIVQSATLHLFYNVMGAPVMPVLPFHYRYYEFQDNFGNIIEIDFHWGDEGYDWEIRGAMVRYP